MNSAAEIATLSAWADTGAPEGDRAELPAPSRQADDWALGTPDLKIVHGHAPAAFAGLPPPDAAFIGGGLGDAGLFEAVWAALKPGGRLVANAVSLGSEAKLIDCFQRHGGELTRLEIAKSGPAGRSGTVFVWRPAAPIIQWRVTKP